MTVPAQIRTATVDDADAIADVHVTTWCETYTGLMPEQFLDASALEARRRMWNTILALDPVPGFSIYLLASEHGTGTGHAMLIDALGDRPAQLWVVSANRRARTFYENHGFLEDDRSIEDPDVEGLRGIRMVR